MEESFVKNSALVVIDLQNDITKNYREIIGKVNEAIDWAAQRNCGSFIFVITICLREQGLSNPAHMAQSWCQS